MEPKKLSDSCCKELAMLAFPDSNSFNDYENSFKFTFRFLFPYSECIMACLAMLVSNRRKIQKTQEVSAKDH